MIRKISFKISKKLIDKLVNIAYNSRCRGGKAMARKTFATTVEETLQDPVISLGYKEVPRARGESKPPEKEILYIMHPRANSGHIMMANL